MPRSLVLLLPLLALLFSFGHWESQKRAVDDEREMRQSLETQLSGRVIAGGMIKTEAISHRDELRSLDSDGLKPLDGLTRLLPIDPDEAGSPELVEMIWQKIDPVLLSKFSKQEEADLRSYLANLTGPGAREQPWICWSPEEPLYKVMAYHEAEKLTGLQRSEITLFANQFLSSGRWTRTATDGFFNTAQGLPVTLTWSIVPDGTISPGLNNAPSAPSNFRAWMASIYGGSATGTAASQPWFAIIESAFAEMAGTCGVHFVYEPNDDGSELTIGAIGVLGTRGDIRLAARGIDGNNGTLAFSFSPEQGDMIFDSGDSTFNNTTSNSIRLFNTTAHELGHALGLDHVCPINQTKLMEPSLTTFFRGARFDEYQSLQRLYGDRFEHHSSDRNNDASARAAILNPVSGTSLILPRLSIDDNGDIDYYRVAVGEGQKLSVSIVPGEGTYLEGPTSGESCSSGTSFNSTSIHNLTLEILGSNGSTLLASSTTGGLGITEKIDNFEFDGAGNYFIRINGGNANAAQLYKMTLLLQDRPPAPLLTRLSATIIAESGSVKNGRLDPGETVKVRVAIRNDGELATSGLMVNATGTANMTVFSATLPQAVIEPGVTSYAEVDFGAAGNCGDLANVNLAFSDASGFLSAVDEEFSLGFSETLVHFDLNFDGSSALPAGWTTSTTGAGIPWATSSAQSDSPLRSAFADNVSAVGQAFLVSPSFVVGASGGNIKFSHLTKCEAGFDGGVLEASRNGGAWFDLPQSEAVVISGGYDSTIDTRYGSPIAGRAAWSGDRMAFKTTSIDFPESWAGESLKLRWNLAHDSSTSREGWFVDNIRVSSLSQDCEPHRPSLSLVISGNRLNENTPGESLELTVSTELPLIAPLSFSLIVTGQGNAGDLNSALPTILPAGQASLVVPISAKLDALVEGPESLTLTLPAGRPDFVPLSPSSVLFTILDATEFTLWQSGFFGTPVAAHGDSDGDGLSELEEYLLGTDPTSAVSKKVITLRPSGDGLLIPVGILPTRSDATLGVEISENLLSWNSGMFTTSSEGILLNPPAGMRFFRLTFSRVE